MEKKQWKLILILAVLGFFLWQLYPTFKYYTTGEKERADFEIARDPIMQKILKLGLDLKGGMHVILELQVDKLESGATIKDAAERAIEILRNRIDQFGVSEPLITKQGERWIVVELPGVKNPERAMELIGKTALLEFKLVEDKRKITDYLDEDNKIKEKELPEDLQILPGKDDRLMLLKKEAELTGAAISNAQVRLGGQNGMPYVALDFSEEGGKVFAKVTERNVQRNMAIVLDGVVQSAPVIKSRIPDGHAVIEGNFTPEEAKNLSIVLKAGALPVPVKIIENVVIGPTLGADSIKKGVFSALVGLLLVVLFMLWYYSFCGLVADIALLVNVIGIAGVMAYLQATLTLPGIAGIILTIGMSVDANVLIFERIREEMALGKTVRMALEAGYQKAFSSIIDSNITTLITALFLFQFGTGPVKGFAVTLSWGIAISMFTAIFVSRYILETYLAITNADSLKIGIDMKEIAVSVAKK